MCKKNKMNKIIISLLVVIALIPIVYAQESDTFVWKFCNEEIEFDYKIINGTLRETAHLKLYDTHHCDEGTNPTDYQLQLFHTSNNQTDFTLMVPDDLEFEKIDVDVVGMGYLESFQLNDTNRIMVFSDFTHNKHGIVTIIMDFYGVEN